MMVSSLAFMLLSPQAPAPQTPVPAPTATARLVGASMFKNGFAITRRVIEVTKPGSTIVVPIPNGAMGTLWFTPDDGMELDSVAVETETTSEKVGDGRANERTAESTSRKNRDCEGFVAC